ncbi:hypothetical protein [Methylobacterium aquaticum]|uniref:hypothetical protein n=1 Tax=Methylobacterium aquaticum TaxID=270351 RepID=UPI003D7C26BE
MGLVAGVVAFGLAGPAGAADMPEPGYWPAPRAMPGPVPPPRYFPRGDSDASPTTRGDPGCQVFVPTNAPGDPTYVGSPFGIGKPSYYGFPPRAALTIRTDAGFPGDASRQISPKRLPVRRNLR